MEISAHAEPDAGGVEESGSEKGGCQPTIPPKSKISHLYFNRKRRIYQVYKKMWNALMKNIADRAENKEKSMEYNTDTYFHILAEMVRIQSEAVFYHEKN